MMKSKFTIRRSLIILREPKPVYIPSTPSNVLNLRIN